MDSPMRTVLRITRCAFAPILTLIGTLVGPVILLLIALGGPLFSSDPLSNRISRVTEDPAHVTAFWTFSALLTAGVLWSRSRLQELASFVFASAPAWLFLRHLLLKSERTPKWVDSESGRWISPPSPPSDLDLALLNVLTAFHLVVPLVLAIAVVSLRRTHLSSR